MHARFAKFSAAGAALIALSVPAMAADVAPIPPAVNTAGPVAPPPQPSITGDLAIFGGLGYHNYDGDYWWALAAGGSARATYWLPSGFSIQADLFTEYYWDFDDYDYFVWHAAGHVGWGDPNALLAGGFLSFGWNGDYGEYFATVAAEAQFAFQRATLYGQLGYSHSTNGDWGLYVHAVGALPLSSTLTATAELGYARIEDNTYDHLLRWGAGLEAAIGGGPWVAFAAYQGTYGWGPGGFHLENYVFAGVKLLINGGNGSLRADYNPFTGNHHQRYY